MKLSEMFPSNLLKSQDLLDEGGEMQLTIERVEMKTFDRDNGGSDTKPLIFFKEDKQMVCNKTNATIIAEMYGDDTDLWTGKEVMLTVKDVEFQGKTVLGIRVKNMNSKDVLVQEFWEKAKMLGYSREDGVKLLEKHNKDFRAATEALEQF